jgi:hypothetical protein
MATNFRERRKTTVNNYEASEVAEIGRAQDVILGSSKFIWTYDDGIGQPKRETQMEEDD